MMGDLRMTLACFVAMLGGAEYIVLLRSGHWGVGFALLLIAGAAHACLFRFHPRATMRADADNDTARHWVPAPDYGEPWHMASKCGDILVDRHGREGGMIFGVYTEARTARAERIMHCVNFCEGLPNEWLVDATHTCRESAALAKSEARS